MEWLDRQWNEPSRTDFYLMQIAHDVERANVGNGKVSDKRIKLIKKAEEKEVKPKNRKEAGELARARWSTLGVGKKK
jgi:hypothetical protein